jgi:hypothetical protein
MAIGVSDIVKNQRHCSMLKMNNFSRRKKNYQKLREKFSPDKKDNAKQFVARDVDIGEEP